MNKGYSMVDDLNGISDWIYCGFTLCLGTFILYLAVSILIYKEIEIYDEEIKDELQTYISEITVGTITVRTITVDEIYVGRNSWNSEGGLWERVEGAGTPGAKLDKEGMTVYNSQGKKKVDIHGYGVFVEEEEEKEKNVVSIVPGEVCVARHIPYDVGGQGAGGEARLFVSKNGARVDVFDYGPYQWAVGLFADLDGGRVSVYKDGARQMGG